MDGEIEVNDLVCRDDSPRVVCRVTGLIGDDWAHFEVVKKDGGRNRNWRRWSGSLCSYRLVRKGEANDGIMA